MPTITLCTFNVENLFGRYKTLAYIPGGSAKKPLLSAKDLKEKGGFLPGQAFAPKNSFEIYNKDDWRKLTAKALKGETESFPDIACLQEVESIQVLRRFNAAFLKSSYKYILLIDSHDPRLIDIGILSKFPIVDTKSHMDVKAENERTYLFSRDCLEVTFDIDGAALTLFVNHLKSKWARSKKEKEEGNQKRKAQAKKVADIVRTRFPGDSFQNSAYAVVGDFNDSPDSEFVQPLVNELGLENVLDRLPAPENKWTYLFSGKNLLSQLDYVLLSPRLSASSLAAPHVERRGMSKSVQKGFLALPDDQKGAEVDLSFKRFPEAEKNPKIEASDHCPLFLELNL